MIKVLATWTKFFFLTILLLYCNQLRLHHLHKDCFWLLPRHYDTIWTCKIELPELDYVTFTCTAFKSLAGWSNAQCVSTPTIIILLWVPSMTWKASIVWCTCHKLAYNTKILQDFWLTLVNTNQTKSTFFPSALFISETITLSQTCFFLFRQHV